MEVVGMNWLAIMLAAVMGFVVGGVWYGPIMGQRWLVATGLSEADIESANMPLVYGCAFALSVVGSAMLGWLYGAFPNLELLGKVGFAAAMALGFILPALGTNYLFARKSGQLFAIDATYWLLFYLALGIVHALLAPY